MGTTDLLKLLSLFTGLSVLQQVRSWSINVPRTVTAVTGSCVVVPCQTQHHSRVIWYQYHSVKYIVVNDELHPNTVVDQFRGRTSVLGKAAEGNCTLKINNVTTADNIKIYVWINPDSKATQRFYDQTVTIFVVKNVPKISIQKKILDGEIFQANCSISHSCPLSPPSLYWNPRSLLENFTLRAFSEKVHGQWLYTETRHGLASYEMHNSEMSCTAHFGTITEKSQTIALKVLYKPVNVTLKLPEAPVMEGGSIIMECAATCNPQPHTYLWLKRQLGQTTKTNSTERKMPLNDITRDTSLSCIAHNDIGAGQSAWLDLDVQHAPVILPESSCHLTGEGLMCVCQAEASPNAFINWTIDGNDTVSSSFSFVSTNKKNVISGVMSGPAQIQSISCTATNSLGSNTKQLPLDNLSKAYAPVILPESSCHLTGEVLKCVCKAVAFPNASLHWTIDGDDTLPSSFSFVSTTKKNLVSGVMSGPAQNQSKISCTATNSLGSNTKELSVDKLSEASSLSTWLTALMLLGVALLLGCAMFFYRKYSRNRQLPGSVCNTTILLRPQSSADNAQPQQIYHSPQRSQDTAQDTPSSPSPSRPERNPEENRPTDVYDNDFVLEMQPTRARQPPNNAAAQREGKVQPLTEDVDWNKGDYLNC